MRKSLKTLVLVIITLGLCFTSCREEDMEIINAPEDDTISANSSISSLMQRVTLNDGSKDNILDKANCIRVQFPLTVIANGNQVVLNSEDDLQDVEAILDQFDDDDDSVDLEFPITVTTEGHVEISIANSTEFNTQISNCVGENIEDIDIECVDFQYPISASIFNINNESFETLSFSNDKELYNFITAITTNDIVTMEFPITARLYDNSETTINTITALESVIENNLDFCDEDDDYDYNDDDCNECTVAQLENLLASCSLWTVDNLERNINEEDYYVGYEFSFAADGSMVADYAIWSWPGTWSASGLGNNITVTIDVPSLPDCNNNWILHEIKTENGQTKFDLNLGDDKIRYVASCDSFDDSELVSTLYSGNWEVAYYFDDEDLTSTFNGYILTFNSSGSIEAELDLVTEYGWWSTLAGDDEALEFNINFGTVAPALELLIEDWDVVSISATTITLREIDLGDGSEDFLTLEKI